VITISELGHFRNESSHGEQSNSIIGLLTLPNVTGVGRLSDKLRDISCWLVSGLKTCFGRSSKLGTVGGDFSCGNLTHGVIYLHDYWGAQHLAMRMYSKTKAARTLAWNSSIESWETRTQGDDSIQG